MWRIFHIPLHERAVVTADGVPVRALGPGRHFVWGSRLDALRWDVLKVVFEAPPEARDVMPRDWWTEVRLSHQERAIVRIDDKPFLWLGPGVHRLFRFDPSLAIEVLSVDGPVPPLTAELRKILPVKEVFEVKVEPHERGLLFIEGRLDRVLEPGRYAFWSPPEAVVDVQRVDVRRQEIAIVGQELMTRDKVTLRLSLTAEVRIIDAVLATQSVANVHGAVYLAVQLAARARVGTMSLDEMLEAREALGVALRADITETVAGYGVEVFAVGIKDIVLPGEMKTIMNRVIEAEKEAAANVILRREETAATRQLANTARLMADNPILMRMRELETLKEIAGQLKEVKLVVGADKLEGLLAPQLLGARDGG